MRPQKLRKSQRSTRRQQRFAANKAFRLMASRIERDMRKLYLRTGPHLYTLYGKEVVPCRRTLAWGRWFEKERYPIGRDYIGDVRVSTVFLGIDHSLFETMIFGGERSEETHRYKTWDEARQGHLAIVGSLSPTKEPQ